MNVPAVVGSNSTLSIAVCFGFSVIGKVAPVYEKPVPVIAAELTVTGELPVEVKVNDCVDGVFKFTLPKVTLVALTLNIAAVGLSCRA